MSFLSNDFSNNPKKVYPFLIILGSIFFVGLGAVHLFDWDEVNFAESTREMLVTGDYLHVQVNYNPFWEKPPLFMWLQSVSMNLFGINEFGARFPNALISVVYLITFYLIGKKHFSAKFGLLWGITFCMGLLPHAYFRSGVIDPVFNYFIFMSIYFMILELNEENSTGKNALLSGLFSGLSLLTKGPVGFLILGLTLFVYLIIKRFKFFPRIKSIGFFFMSFICTISVWILWEYLANGTENLFKFIEYQLALFGSNVAGHEQPFFYHFVVVFLGCFPIIQFALPQFRKTDDHSGIDLRKWMLILFWVVLILFSIVKTKIIHYSSLTYIPIAFLAACFLSEIIEGKRTFPKWLIVTIFTVGLILGVVITAVIFLFQFGENHLALFTDEFTRDCMSTPTNWLGFEFFLGFLFIILFMIGIFYLVKSDAKKGVIILLINTTLTLGFAQLFVLPRIEEKTQGPMIRMFESLQSQECHVEVIGFKSYAHYFYARVKPGQVIENTNDAIRNNFDKPVYYVVKSNNDPLGKRPNMHLVYRQGGYKLYKKEPQIIQ